MAVCALQRTISNPSQSTMKVDILKQNFTEAKRKQAMLHANLANLSFKIAKEDQPPHKHALLVMEKMEVEEQILNLSCLISQLQQEMLQIQSNENAQRTRTKSTAETHDERASAEQDYDLAVSLAKVNLSEPEKNGSIENSNLRDDLSNF